MSATCDQTSDAHRLQRQEKVIRGGETVTARFYVLVLKILDDSATTGPKEAPP